MTFSFTTNIELLMPDTGKVYCIDRMTSDYAHAHPLDVDLFIENVYQEFAGTEFEESREVLRSVWDAVLSVTSPCGDASLYPNKNGAKRAAAMKVWHKAGDYWRRGLRIGDTLPDMVPMTKISRLDDGSWIALFPKDAYLIENEEVNCEQPIIIEPSQHQSEPQQLDLFAFEQLQQENERLRLHLSQAQEQRAAAVSAAPSTASSPHPRRQRQPRKPAAVCQSNSVCPAIPLQEGNHDLKNLFKAVGMVAAATVALFGIYETGLLIPLGLIGLATGGLLK